MAVTLLGSEWHCLILSVLKEECGNLGEQSKSNFQNPGKKTHICLDPSADSGGMLH